MEHESEDEFGISLVDESSDENSLSKSNVTTDASRSSIRIPESDSEHSESEHSESEHSESEHSESGRSERDSSDSEANSDGTDSGSEDEIMKRRNPFGAGRRNMVESDDDDDIAEASSNVDDDKANEVDMMLERKNHRRSTRFRVASSDEDDDEDDDEEDEQKGEAFESSYSNDRSISLDFGESLNGAAEHNSKRDRSVAVNNSIATRTPDPKRRSTNLTTSTPSTTHTASINSFDQTNISTSETEIQNESSVEVMDLTKNMSIIQLDDSDVIAVASSSNVTKASVSGVSKQLVQPKLSFGKKMSLDAEIAKLKEDLKATEDLLEKFKNTLPDNGANLKKSINALRAQIIEKERHKQQQSVADSIELIDSDDESNDKDWKEESVGKEKVTKSWDEKRVQRQNDDWRDGINKIQPKHTGEQGMETHNIQKALTLNRIAKLHKAMERCPLDHELAPQPEHLKVDLMRHQKHALKWTRWRETQKPKGGILADDMGLGKTMTMLALVLDVKYHPAEGNNGTNTSEVTSTDDEEDDDDDDVQRVGGKARATYEGGTLIVCPASLLNQWKHEEEIRVKRNKLAVYAHHGASRKTSVRAICAFDIVITTYGIVASEFERAGVLFKIKWERIILDEAHQIRNHNTAASKACCDLRADIRWALTGTPVQNQHMDVYVMLKYLRVRPFNDLQLFKKWVDVKTTDGMKRLHNILKPLLLRRTKAELQNIGELQGLPSKSVSIESIQLTSDESNIYTKFLAYSQTLFAQYMAQSEAKTGIFNRPTDIPAEVKKMLHDINQKFGLGMEVNASKMLVLILRLRQICCHPGLIGNMLAEDLEDEPEDKYDEKEMEMVKQMIGLNIGKNTDANDSNEEDRTSNLFSKSNKIYDFNTPSSKCNKIDEIVKRVMRETDDKIILVSQWTSLLNIVKPFLGKANIKFVELSGKTAIDQRNDIVVNFNNPNTSERVMLLSLKAGGVGLNLTGANHLMLLDPHWNPQLESQACDRVYRVGQTKEVYIYKLICDNTIEKHIQTIQENKLELANNILTGSNKSTSSKLSLQDMRMLFNM